MDYSKQYLEHVVEQFGEVFVVLDSDREYEIHGKESYELKTRGTQTIVRVEGMQGDEWVITEFPLDAVEHHYTHRDV